VGEGNSEIFSFVTGLSRVVECPVCDSENVRVSFSTPVVERIYRWQGLQRYRCRDCRKVFHLPLAPGEEFARKPPRRRRRDRLHREDLVLPRWGRNLLEATLFVVLLVVFYVVLSAAYAAIGVPDS
jgi:hypothetical protein